MHDHASQSSTENCARSAPIFRSQEIQNGEGTNQASCLEVQPQPSVKSKKGVFKAGYKLRKRRWYWRGNSGRQNVIKEVQADEHLQAVIGVERATRGQILRLIWVYIRNNNLQNPLNRKMIIPDQTLAAVIGANEILCCQMMKNLEQHIVTPK